MPLVPRAQTSTIIMYALSALVFALAVSFSAGAFNGGFLGIAPKISVVKPVVPIVPRTVAQVATWSLWSKFTICTATCGGGIQLRRRECLVRKVYSQGYNQGVSVCAGASVDIALCNTQRCIIPGGWTPWSIYTPCCSGLQIRHRTCTNPTPVNAPQCKGDAVETRHCPKGEVDVCGCPLVCQSKVVFPPPVTHVKKAASVVHSVVAHGPHKKHGGYADVKSGLIRVPNKG